LKHTAKTKQENYNSKLPEATTCY